MSRSRQNANRQNAVRALTRRSFLAGAAALVMLPALGGCKDTDRLQERIIDTTAEEIDETLKPVHLSKLRAPQLQDERRQHPDDNENDRESDEDEPDNQDRNNQDPSNDLPDYDNDPTSDGKTNSNASVANADGGTAAQGTNANGEGGVNGEGGEGAQGQPSEQEDAEAEDPSEANPGDEDTEEPTPTNPVTPGETYGEDGNYKKLPRATSGIAAVGQYALIVQMLGGKGALKATNADFLDNMPSAAFSNGTELEGVQVAWKGDGSKANAATVKAIIDSGADVALTSPSAGDLSDYSKELTAAGVNVVTMPVIGVCNAYDSDITNTVLYIGELLKNMEDACEYDAKDAAQRYVAFHDEVLAQCIDSSHNKGYTTYNRMPLELWNSAMTAVYQGPRKGFKIGVISSSPNRYVTSFINEIRESGDEQRQEKRTFGSWYAYPAIDPGTRAGALQPEASIDISDGIGFSVVKSGLSTNVWPLHMFYFQHAGAFDPLSYAVFYDTCDKYGGSGFAFNIDAKAIIETGDDWPALWFPEVGGTGLEPSVALGCASPTPYPALIARTMEVARALQASGNKTRGEYNCGYPFDIWVMPAGLAGSWVDGTVESFLIAPWLYSTLRGMELPGDVTSFCQTFYRCSAADVISGTGYTDSGLHAECPTT